VIYVYRRLASSRTNNADNSHVENAPNMYQLSSGRNSQHAYSTVAEASAPAQSTNVTKSTVVNGSENGTVPPLVAAQRPSLHEVTLVDNDLYD